MTTLITGGAGFIGSHVAKRLKVRGEPFVLLDNFSPFYNPVIKWTNIEPLGYEPERQLVQADICELNQLNYVFEKYPISRVLHLAAIPGVRPSRIHPRRYTMVNTYGTNNVLQAAREHGVKQVVFASSSSVYGIPPTSEPMKETDPAISPLSPYAATKRAAEILAYPYTLYEDAMDITILRLFNIYGPNGRPDMMPIRIMQNILGHKPTLLYAGGEVERDWTYIDDAVDAIIAALLKPMGYCILNIGRGKPCRIEDMIDTLSNYLGVPAIREHVDLPDGEVTRTCADIAQAAKLLYYDPQIDLAEGLGRTWEWFKDWAFKNDTGVQND